MNEPEIVAYGRHFINSYTPAEFKSSLVRAFKEGRADFIVLDNKITALSEAQCAWLEGELKKSLSYKHRFVLMHKQAISLYQQSWFRPELGVWSYKTMKLFQKYNVDIVFTGHEHMFRENQYGGVRYVTTGGGGMFTQIPNSDGGYLHYVVVRVFGDYVDYEVRRICPPFWEFVTYYMWKEVFYGLKGMFFKDGFIF